MIDETLLKMICSKRRHLLKKVEPASTRFDRLESLLNLDIHHRATPPGKGGDGLPQGKLAFAYAALQTACHCVCAKVEAASHDTHPE